MAFPSTYRNVVVAYDGSDGARAALARAAEIADKDDSSLTLVEAVPGKGAVTGTRRPAAGET